MALIFDSFGADLVALIIVFITSSYFYLKYKFTYWSSKGVPCLTPSVPFGNAGNQLMMRKNLGEIVEDVYVKLKKDGHKYGGMYLVATPNFVPIDPDMVKMIMTGEFQSFHDRATLVNEEADPLSGNLFALKGYKWRNLRVKLTPTFTSGKMKMMFQMLLVCGEQLDQAMRDCVKQKGPIDIKDMLGRFTTDVIGTVAFGLNCNSLENPDSEFRKYGKMVFDNSFFDNLRNMGQLIAPDLLKLFNISTTPTKLNKFFMDVVKQTVDYREKNKIVRNDFLNLLIKLKNNENIDDDNKGDVKNEQKTTTPGLTMNELTAQAFVFFLAGFETSSSTMTFALYELCVNSEMQDKLREEIREALKKGNGKFTYETIMEMSYMDKIVKGVCIRVCNVLVLYIFVISFRSKYLNLLLFSETLRKYPIVPVLSRECVKDFKIPDSDVIIDKGTAISISALGLQRDPEYYPDPMKFDPERFNEENKATRHPYTYIPFGEGPRNCIGEIFYICIIGYSFQFICFLFEHVLLLICMLLHHFRYAIWSDAN